MKDIFRFNGQHYERITPIQQLKNRITELEKENTELLESNANLAFHVNEQESQINILSETIEDLEIELDGWENR